ncbi:hypothetical protein Pr1d_34920 [Bythopirellula goksoeyrii]|uniref:Uncharacterized protein n=1 Tax=Bythopirellula goksoeyrii TaxID=1400387 RepID=A0A5B9QQE3_9BACT|nr:hypothetical protein Pr1d_34920 [Bythopirellula goksoeyrii]
MPRRLSRPSLCENFRRQLNRVSEYRFSEVLHFWKGTHPSFPGKTRFAAGSTASSLAALVGWLCSLVGWGGTFTSPRSFQSFLGDSLVPCRPDSCAGIASTAAVDWRRVGLQASPPHRVSHFCCTGLVLSLIEFRSAHSICRTPRWLFPVSQDQRCLAVVDFQLRSIHSHSTTTGLSWWWLSTVTISWVPEISPTSA